VNPIVVDSSVAFKWLSTHGEHGVEDALELLDSHESGRELLTAPAILHVELANALRNSSRLDEDSVLALVEELGKYRVELVPSTPERLLSALRLSYRHAISVYDALFLALAEELGCPLITADRKAFADIDTDVEIRLI
jgi:predicted nucleic acid-binding protein